MGRHQESRQSLTSLCPRRSFKEPSALTDRPQLCDSKPFCYMPFAETSLSTTYKQCITCRAWGLSWEGEEEEEKKSPRHMCVRWDVKRSKHKSWSKTRGSPLIMEIERGEGWLHPKHL